MMALPDFHARANRSTTSLTPVRLLNTQWWMNSLLLRLMMQLLLRKSVYLDVGFPRAMGLLLKLAR